MRPAVAAAVIVVLALSVAGCERKGDYTGYTGPQDSFGYTSPIRTGDVRR